MSPRSTRPPVEKVRRWTVTHPDPEVPRPEPAAYQDPAWAAADPTHVRHGYTMRDIDGITSLAITRGYGWLAGDIEDRHAAARLAVVELLYATDAPPTRHDLVNAAWKAEHRHVVGEMREHGVQRAERGGGTMPSFERYWWAAGANIPSHENRIVERMAVGQILPLLTDGQRAAVTALCELGDYRAAAEALGLKAGAFDARLAGARGRFNAAWFEHETPPTAVRRDRRVWSRSGLGPGGRARLTASQVEAIRQRRHAGELVRDMAADAGVTPQALHALLRGARRPAPDPEDGAR